MVYIDPRNFIAALVNVREKNCKRTSYARIVLFSSRKYAPARYRISIQRIPEWKSMYKKTPERIMCYIESDNSQRLECMGRTTAQNPKILILREEPLQLGLTGSLWGLTSIAISIFFVYLGIFMHLRGLSPPDLLKKCIADLYAANNFSVDCMPRYHSRKRFVATTP